MPLVGLHLEPGQDLFGEVGADHPLELAGEGELPVEAGDDEEEQGGRFGRRATGCGTIHILDRRLLFFVDAADVRPAGAAVQHAGQFGELATGADGVDFDAAVVEIAGVAGEAEFDGGALGEVAIAYALDSARDVPAAGVHGFGFALLIGSIDSVSGWGAGWVLNSKPISGEGI